MVNQNPFKDTCGKTIDYSHPELLYDPDITWKYVFANKTAVVIKSHKLLHLVTTYCTLGS